MLLQSSKLSLPKNTHRVQTSPFFGILVPIRFAIIFAFDFATTIVFVLAFVFVLVLDSVFAVVVTIFSNQLLYKPSSGRFAGFLEMFLQADIYILELIKVWQNDLKNDKTYTCFLPFTLPFKPFQFSAIVLYMHWYFEFGLVLPGVYLTVDRKNSFRTLIFKMPAYYLKIPTETHFERAFTWVRTCLETLGCFTISLRVLL